MQPAFSRRLSSQITGTPPVNALGYLRIMFAMDDIDDRSVGVRLPKRG
jgi:hypothetical protein